MSPVNAGRRRKRGQTDGWMDGRGFIRNSNRGSKVKRNNEKQEICIYKI